MGTGTRGGIGAALLCVLGAGACSSMTEPRREPVRDLTPAELTVASASTVFGLELFAAAVAVEAEPNVLLSPMSAAMALGMTMNGARSTTLDELRGALGFGELSQAAINAAYRGLIAQLLARDADVEFTLANSLWHERSFNVLAPFIDSVRIAFDAQVTALDFAAPSAVNTINQWAADRTGNRIRDLLDSIDPLEKMFLVNAVYFKAPWARPFMQGATQPRPFRTLAGATVQAPTMLRDETTSYFSGDGVHLVELPYAGGAFRMTLLMPQQEDRPLSALVERLSAQQWDRWLEQTTETRLLLQLPKFRFDYDTDLSDALHALGVIAAFDPNISDFSGINNERDDIYISRVEQKSFIDVHELGTEAAAATAVGISVTSLPPSIHFDRPFLFAIREASSNAILFIGRIGDPTR